MNLDELEALAQAATPGPWRMETGAQPFHEILGSVLVGPVDFDDLCDEQRMMSLPNAAFIAAANPATVLALIERVRILERIWEDAAEECWVQGGGTKESWKATLWKEAQEELDRLKETA